jgi:hypothetical protein
MKILLTGTTGYIAQRLLSLLLNGRHELYCCLRDKTRFDMDKYKDFNITLLEVDFLNADSLSIIPTILMLPITSCIQWMLLPTSLTWMAGSQPTLRTSWSKPVSGKLFI